MGGGVKNGEAKFETCNSGCEAGVEGTKPGDMSDPAYIAMSGTTIYVTDYNSDHVDEFNTSREYVTDFGVKGTGNGDFVGPTGITVGIGGNVFVVDSENRRVEEFSAAGSYMSMFGEAGTGGGQLGSAEGLAVSTSEDIYVMDSANNRAEEWAPSLTGNSGAYASQVIYYTPKTEATVG
jgi:tripartite motif-containing protein 71